MSEENKTAAKAEAKNEKKPAAAKAPAKKPEAKEPAPAKWGMPDWACEHPWTEMSRKQRKRVAGLLPPCVGEMVDELADLRERLAKMFRYLDGGVAKKAGQPEHALAFAQGIAMDNYECFLRQRVDLAVHDALRAAWDKKDK